MSKSREKENKRGFIEYLSVKAELPSDTLSGNLRIELRGKNSVFVGGCRRILSYSPLLIVLEVKGDKIRIKGKRLICTSYHADAVSIEGLITSVCFDGEEDDK